jgi:ubiquinol-cytochrome c reductase iron-sulfur subunit
MATWPFIDSMNPAADALAAGNPIDLDFGSIRPGRQTVASWRGNPIFIVIRPAGILETLQQSSLTARLRDADSETHQQPPYAKKWHRSIVPEYQIVVGTCTHLGCIPKFRADVGAKELQPRWPGGYFCSCHGSKYDFRAAFSSGVPAPYNLPVPPSLSFGETLARRRESGRSEF